MELYPTIPIGDFRNNFVEQLNRVLSNEQWVGLTGNPDRILVKVSNFYHDPKKDLISFGFRYITGKGLIYEPPVVYANRMDDDGNSIETKAIPAMAHYPKEPWGKPQYHHSSVHIYLPKGAIGVGKWQFYVEGTEGEGEVKKWRSEPWELEVKVD